MVKWGQANFIAIAKQEGLDYLCGIIEDAAHAVAHETG
jgi:hypothetical protein